MVFWELIKHTFQFLIEGVKMKLHFQDYIFGLGPLHKRKIWISLHVHIKIKTFHPPVKYFAQTPQTVLISCCS
jgi:hypothetical protein